MSVSLAPVAVVTSPSRTLNRWVSARRRHHQGVCCVDVAPVEAPTMLNVAQAIIDGLGKNPDVTTMKASTEALATAWLSLGEITDVFVPDAQLLPVRVIGETITLLAQHNIRCWLLLSTTNTALTESPIHPYVQLVDGHGGHTIGEADLRAAFPDVTRRQQHKPTVRPRLPRVDGVAFRSACRDLLEPDHFAEIDGRFVGLVRELRAEIAAITGKNKTRTLARMLKARLAETGDTDTFVLTVRAAQVAALTAGFQIRVNTAFMIGAAEAIPRRGRATAERWWEQLDLYRDPSLGAIAALYTYGANTVDIPTIALCDVSAPDATGNVTVGVAESGVLIPAPAGRFLTAQVMFRHCCGADDTDLLFTSHRADDVSVAYVASQLNMTAGDVGVAVAFPPVRSRQLDGPEWLRRYGIKIDKLSYTPTGEAVAS